MAKEVPGRSARMREKRVTRTDPAAGSGVRDPGKLAHDLIMLLHDGRLTSFLAEPPAFFIVRTIKENGFEFGSRPSKKVLTLVKGRIIEKGKVDVPVLKAIMLEIGQKAIEKDQDVRFDSNDKSSDIALARRDLEELRAHLDTPGVEKELRSLILKHRG